ncbi:MAG TPA: hypothetical protein VH482_15345 [Thermomicrobiales bacterium]|jgi:hypothetical protein
MRRLISSLFALILLLGGGGAALARQGTPTPFELSPGITAAFSVSVPVDALPADSGVVLFARYRLAPGAEVPASAGQNIAMVYVESGELTLTGNGPASIYRGGQSQPKAEPNEPGVEEVLAAGDILYSPVCSVTGLRNDGAAPLSVLLGGVTGFGTDTCPGATPVAESTDNTGLVTDFLALGQTKPPATLPAQLAIVKATYAPGASDPPGANSGTVLARVDSGTFSLTMSEGEGTIIRKPADPSDFFSAQQDPLVAGVEATLNPGDMVWEAGGTSIQGRNSGTEPATVVLFVLVSNPASPATPTT